MIAYQGLQDHRYPIMVHDQLCQNWDSNNFTLDALTTELFWLYVDISVLLKRTLLGTRGHRMFKVNEKTKIRSRYNRILHPAITSNGKETPTIKTAFK